MPYKLLKCPTCYLKRHEEVWLPEEDVLPHLHGVHHAPHRTLDNVINSWKALGLYEEKTVEKKPGTGLFHDSEPPPKDAA